MSAVANIVLNDAQATPVAHTFIPLGPDAKGVWWWEDQTGSSPLGYNRISMQLSRAAVGAAGVAASTNTSRVKIRLYTPKLETLGTNDAGITPPNQVAYVPNFTGEFVISDRSILQDRKDLRKYIDFLMAETQLTNMVENLQNVF